MKADSISDVALTEKEVVVKLPTLQITDDHAEVIVASANNNYYNSGGQRETNCCGCDVQLDE